MAEEFPTALLKDAIPSADRNMAGVKPVNMNAMPPARAAIPQQPVAPAKPKRIRKPAAVAPPPPPPAPQIRPQFQPRPALPQDAAKLAQIHQTLDVMGAGGIKHGTGSPYANYDPFSDTNNLAEGGIIESQAQQAPALPPMQPGGPLVPSDDELMATGVQPAPVIKLPFNPPPVGTYAQQPGRQPGFLQQTCRVSLELTDGSMTLPAIAIKESQYSVLLILRLDANSSIFVPKPATKLKIGLKDKSWDVYYPGTYVEIEELGIGLMTFIKEGG